MVSLRLNETRAKCPTSYKEVSTKVFQSIYADWGFDKELHERDFFKLFSILTETDFKDVERSIENETAIWELTNWVIQRPPEFDLTLPEHVELWGKKFALPKKVKSLTIGQNILVHQHATGRKHLEESIAYACAVFIQTVVDGKPNTDRVKEIEQIFLERPITETYPIGFFTLALVAKHSPKHSQRSRLTQSSLKLRRRKMFHEWPTLTGFRAFRVSRLLRAMQSYSALILTMFLIT